MQNRKYCIKSCPTNDSEQLELLLNTMSAEGYELYSMQEAEGEEEDSYVLNCIFIKDYTEDDFTMDFANLVSVKSKMERIMSQKTEPYDVCLEIQKKIKEKRQKVNQIKSLLDSTSEDSRKHLNEEMSTLINELDKLKKQFFEYLAPSIMYSKLGEKKLSIQLSEELIDLVSIDSDVNLLTSSIKLRQDLAEDLGYIIPEIRVENGELLESNEFVINVRGIPAVKSSAYPNCIMFFKDELNSAKLPKNAIKGIDPITKKKIVWIEESIAKDYWTEGYYADEYITRLLEYAVMQNVEEIFDYADLNSYMEVVADKSMFLIENILPDFISISELKYLLTSLIKERVSIKDILFIFECLNDIAGLNVEEDVLTALRRAMARKISYSVSDKNDEINIIKISDKTIKDLGLSDKNNRNVVKITSKSAKDIAEKIKNILEEKKLDLKDIVLLTNSKMRLIMFLILKNYLYDITVLSTEEISNEYKQNVIGTI